MLSRAPARSPASRTRPGVFSASAGGRRVLPALVLAAAAALGSCDDGASGPRNVILVSIDTLRPDHLSCYGYPRETSPNLDALARAGVRFSDVTAAAPWTLPSHATMLTGLYPIHHGVKSHSMRLPTSIQTLAEEFQDNGFETIAVVNTHNLGAPQFQMAQGFEHFAYVEELEEDPLSMRLFTRNRGAEVTAIARRFLEQRDSERPFFLFLHFYDAHTDFTPDEGFRKELVGPYGGAVDGTTLQLNNARNKGELLSEDDLRHLRELYDAEIRTMDETLGQFLGWLDDEGLREDALLAVTSDHGEEFQEHGSLLHGRTQYQELLSVPMILTGRGLPAGLVVDAPVHGIDVTPTLLAIMGIVPSAAHDGLDLSPTWSGGRLPERLLFGEADRDNRYAEMIDVKTMVRRGSSKLIFDRKAGKPELYDLERDPGEQNDLHDGQRELARELALELRSFMAGAREPERIAPPTAAEQAKIEALGYGGAPDEESTDEEATDEEATDEE